MRSIRSCSSVTLSTSPGTLVCFFVLLIKNIAFFFFSILPENALGFLAVEVNDGVTEENEHVGHLQRCSIDFLHFHYVLEGLAKHRRLERRFGKASHFGLGRWLALGSKSGYPGKLLLAIGRLCDRLIANSKYLHFGA